MTQNYPIKTEHCAVNGYQDNRLVIWVKPKTQGVCSISKTNGNPK